jgi:hypothetical protein
MHWEPMSLDEFAKYRSEEGMKLVKVDDIWWAEVRPFFFRPLFPFCEIEPGSRRYPASSRLGGLVHLVPAADSSASHLNFHVYDDLKNYSPELLSGKRRKNVLATLNRFEVRSIPSPEEFVNSGYPVYQVFFRRTNYWYLKNRVFKENFRSWAETLYRYPKISKAGIYQAGRLCAVETSFRVGDVIFGDHLFSDNDSLRSHVMDFLMHRLREAAARSDARYFFSGLPTGVATLDNSNTKKGCKLLQLPAYCRINPVALGVAKLFMPDSYRKLVTVLGQRSVTEAPPGVLLDK